jgi:hypothetical protein
MNWKFPLVVLLPLFSCLCFASLTPISSSLGPGVESSADNACSPVDDSALQAQGPTLNPLAASVNALSVCNVASVNTHLAIEADWTNASQGTVKFTNVGWTTSNVSLGWAYAFQGNDYTYNFIANNNEPLTLYYASAGGGSDGGFGLFGYYATLSGPNGSTATLLVNTAGTVTWDLVAGSSYSLNIYNEANLWGPLGSITDTMHGYMHFSTPSPVPEASSFVLLGSGALSMLACLLRKTSTGASRPG